MRHRLLALTGPAAAAAYQLDGFREHDWPLLWCAPASSEPAPNVIRTRRWSMPSIVGDQILAPIDLVLRHLNAVDLAQYPKVDNLTPRDRVEFALEHALRDCRVDLEKLTFTGGPQLGSNALYQLLRMRGAEPPTGSYFETQLLQFLRSLDLDPWRQVHIFERGKIKHRADFVVPYGPMLRRPKVILPHHGFIVEADSREWHEGKFLEDHHRNTTYDVLGYQHVEVTPQQLEDDPFRVAEAIMSKFRFHLKARRAG